MSFFDSDSSDQDFFLILGVTFLILTVLSASCSEKPTSSKNVIVKDTEILKARNYISEYNQRLEQATNETRLCFTENKSPAVVDRCVTMIYDKYQIDYNISESTGLVKLDRNMYNEQLNIAINPLSTEFKNENK